MPELHPRTRELLDFLADHRQRLERAVQAVPAALVATRPADDRWSVAEIVEHLAIVEGRIVGLLERGVEEGSARGLPRETDESSVLGRLDTARLVDRTDRVVATEPSRPGGRLPLASALEQLTSNRARTRALLERTSGLALGALTAPHPRLGVLDFYQWLLFLGAHEGRHAAQIQDVAVELAAR